MGQIPNAAEDLRLETAKLVIEHTNIVERAAPSGRQVTVEELTQRMGLWDFAVLRKTAHWCQSEPGARGTPPKELVELLDVFGAALVLKGQEAEAVNHPQHYGGDTPYEAIKVMLAWYGPERTRWFCVLSAVKYVSRMGKKPGEPLLRDLKKAIWYLEYAAKLSDEIEAEKK